MKNYTRQCLILAASLAAFASGCGVDADNKTDENTIRTESGLQYVELREGEGTPAKKGDTVEVFYTGWLTSGKQFDSNVGKEPFLVTIGQTPVILGWTQGLIGMKAGGKRRLVIPPELGYGQNGHPPVIPPNAELIFEVEVVKIKSV